MKDLTRLRAENQVLDTLSLESGQATAHLIVDQDHPFFYDHPLDHIPGLLLIEAACQLVGHWADQTSPPAQLYLSKLKVRFLKYALHGAPVTLSLTKSIRDVGVSVFQSGVRRAQVSFSLGSHSPSYDFLGTDQCSRQKMPMRLAADGARLNKHHAANVMISTPEKSEDVWSAELLAPNPDCALSDCARVGYWHPLCLLEAYMQVLRFQNSAPGADEPRGRMRDILCGINLHLRGPVKTDQHVRLISSLNQTYENRLLTRQGRLYSGNVPLASVEILTARPAVRRNTRAKVKPMASAP